jgi:hypothetical protein
MTVTTFFIATGITLLIAFIIRLFWLQILIVGYTLYIVGMLGFYSLITALIWSAIFSDNYEGFYLLWLYVFMLFSIMVVVYVIIVFDIASMAIDFIRKIFKI